MLCPHLFPVGLSIHLCYLEAVGEELQLGEEFSVGVQVLQCLQTLQTHLALLGSDHTERDKRQREREDYSKRKRYGDRDTKPDGTIHRKGTAWSENHAEKKALELQL